MIQVTMKIHLAVPFTLLGYRNLILPDISHYCQIVSTTSWSLLCLVSRCNYGSKCPERFSTKFISYTRYWQMVTPLLVFLKTVMTDFPTLAHTSTNEIPTLSYTWRRIKVPIFCGVYSRVRDQTETGNPYIWCREKCHILIEINPLFKG